MTIYKLYYFNVTGLAEPIRYLLHYCGIPFEDIRFEDYEEWTGKYKKDMPMEQVPVLEIDGVKYHQHISICRSIAKMYRLHGSSAEESLKLDSLLEDINDIRIEIGNYFKEEDSTFKAKLYERLLLKIPFYFGKFEEQVAANDGFFFNNKISLADIYYAGVCEIMSNILGYDVNKDYENLRKLTEKVRSHERIKAYIQNRPKTDV